jgi:ribosome-associated heat shock protein Hsp15
LADKNGEDAGATLRADKWLFHARFFKSRTLAAKMIATRKLRVNGALTAKAHYAVCRDDVLTFPKGPHIKIVKIVALGSRRGPAPEAQALYEDLSPPPPKKEATAARPAPVAAREKGAGRPTKAERRALDKLRAGS